MAVRVVRTVLNVLMCRLVSCSLRTGSMSTAEVHPIKLPIVLHLLSARPTNSFPTLDELTHQSLNESYDLTARVVRQNLSLCRGLMRPIENAHLLEGPSLVA